MECKHFGMCGACRVYEHGYEAQLNEKVALNKERFAPFYSGVMQVIQSPQEHYRFRSEFKIWHVEDNIMHYAMTNKEKNGVVLIEECPQVNHSIFNLMPKLLEAISSHKIGRKLFAIDFLSSSSGEIVASLLYHRKLDEAWHVEVLEIAKELGIHIIGRSRGQKVVIGQDFVLETLNIGGANYKFHHIENSFTQPNPRVNEEMITWALKNFSNREGDLLELYCGAGNFTIPFSKKFNKILATEISKSSINAAKANMLLNGVTNIEFVRMSVEEFTQALDGVREFNRMKEVDVSRYALKSIFVDPPRSGMDEASCNFAARYEHILYISCNPMTLVRDLEILCKTHIITDMALFDQFPYTEHVEMGVKLIQKGLK